MAKKDTIKKAPVKVTPAAASGKFSFFQLVKEVQSAFGTTFDDYVNTLTPRLKMIDLFLVFLVALGILQFVYVLLVGNFPFNAFLGGFISCVGQFVLVVSLRLQIKSEVDGKISSDLKGDIAEDINDENVVIENVKERTFQFISPERSFGDFIFASLILHFVVYHFIN